MELFKTLILKEPKSSRRLARFRNLHHSWDARVILPSVLAILLFPLFGTAQTAANGAVNPVPKPEQGKAAGSGLTVVSQIGNTDSAFRDGKLLTYHRAKDPFAVPVRGKFRGLPPVIAQKPATPGAAVPSVGPPTLAMAVEALPVGAVDPHNREMLVGRHLVREGDLLVIELSGYRFVVWVQSIDQRGVQICDLGLKQHALRPFRAGPMEPAADPVVQPNNVQSFLQQHEG
ncbi:MAG: hypothetical protein JO170_13210 [Verrucomicrobia bacterium]|nr:hypothetical protein [Verrucomicrobiota bacterium]